MTTEHIFPIIKRWLYSDKEIFLREIVSNASDAIVKFKRLVSLGETDAPDAPGRIDVVLDAEQKTIRVSDNGIGMTRDEVDRYLVQIALSGALEFLEKYEGENAAESGIIGHFGLGFYSAFMVADRVEVFTKSHTGESAVTWDCNELGAYTITEGGREERGTTVVLHLNEEESEYLKEERLRAILEKYCAFLAFPIYLSVAGAEAKGTEAKEEVPVNDTEPLWLKKPADLTDKDYEDFYHKLFGYDSEPLFWIHINADYPLNFRGVLYFPRLKHEFASMEGEVKLYYNRVFVADNVPEIIPEYLLSLKGVLDCPELPLNVSRSFLQNNAYVGKLSAHVSKKVCDKIVELSKNEREKYESFSPDLKPFLEYGSMKDEKFLERIKDVVLYKTTKKTFVTLEEYLDAAGEKTVYYTTDPVRQSRFVTLLEEQGKTVCVLDSILDTQYLSFLEARDPDLKFLRVDSGVEALAETEGETDHAALRDAFSGILPEGVKLAFAHLKNADTPAILTCPEESRRMADLMRLYRMQKEEDLPPVPKNEVLTVNTICPVCEDLCAIADQEKRTRLAKQIYYTALLTARTPEKEELEAFLENNLELIRDAMA